MIIRIVRNESGNCINFYGSSNPTYWNACLSGEVDLEDNTLVNIVNDIKTSANGTKEYEFFKIPYTVFRDADGNTFADANAVASYIDINGNVTSPNFGVYKGEWDASQDFPNPTPNGGDWYFVSVEGNKNPNDVGGADLTPSDGRSSYFIVNDVIKYNGTSWGHIKSQAVRVDAIENSALGAYSLYVDPNTTIPSGSQTGSNLKPFSSLQDAVDAVPDKGSIYIKGVNVISSEITWSSKSISFYGSSDSVIKYATFNAANGNIISFEGDGTQKVEFNDITFRNSGGYGLLLKNLDEVNLRSCEFYNNGFSGNGISTVLPESGGVLGYDSSQVDLQAFYAGAEASNGGAVRVEECRKPMIRECRAESNLRGFRLQDCGINGGGFVIENQAVSNIESGIYLAGAALNGCQNITVAVNYSAFNANNGLLVIGGLNNKFSQNEVRGNWNAGLCGWATANLTLRDCGLYDNNRSQFNGIGNNGDAMASIQLSDASSYLASTITFNQNYRFLAEVLDTQVHYTGLGSNTDKVGFLITNGMGLIPDNSKNIIKVDDVGFIGQDYAIDLSAVDISNLRVSLGDNSYQSIGQKAVKAPLNGNYSELPFSNHVMQVPEVDVVVDTLKKKIALHEGVGGNVINTYDVNELSSDLKPNSLDIIINKSNKIQLRDLTFGNIYINGVVAGNNLNSANDSLIAAFNMNLIQYKDFLVSEVGINGDASSGGSLPAQVNNWYIAYGARATEQITSAGIVADIKDQQPFYNGDFLEKGHEYVWSHYDNADYMIGIYSGAEEKKNEQDAVNPINWEVGFFFDENNDNFNPNFSSGCDLASRYSTGYAMNSNKVLALRYGNDNYLYLLDITGGSEVIIAKSNLTLIGDTQTIFFAGENQPNAQFPVMQERTERWTIVADYDGSENGEWVNGIENQTVIKSNMSISSGEKFVWTLPAVGVNRSYGIGYIGASTGQGNVVENFTARWRWDAQELIQYATTNGWTFNTENTYYDSINSRWNLTTGQPVQVSYRHTDSNVLKMFDETHGELIMTLDASTNGTPIHLYFGANAYASDLSQIPVLSKYNMVDSDEGTNVTGWYYIESPDGNFEYPLFATEAEANYIDGVEGGSNTSSTQTYVDDLSGTTWYKPTTNFVDNGTVAPQHGIYGNSINVLWNEIATGEDSNYTPTFNDITYTIQEGGAVNIQYKGQGDTNIYNVTNIPSGYADTGFSIVGTAETITDGVDIQHVINVTKANDFGSDTGTITLNVTDDPTNNVTPNLTSWTKAIDFSGSNEHLKQVSTSTSANPLRMSGLSSTVSANSNSSKTSSSSSARPWATAIVFKPDGNNSNQHIWNTGEGTSSTNDNIYLRLDASGNLYFGWGRQGSLNECVIGAGFSSSSATSQYWGVYIAHKGTRLSGSNATASNLADCFDIRIMYYAGGSWVFAGVDGNFADSVGNRSTATNWGRSGSSTGGRMDRSVNGDFTIGGRGGNRNFHGKVASMVIATLRTDFAMPDSTEIKLMITDPKKWEDDYRVGNFVRWVNSTSFSSYTPSNINIGYGAVQMWLMGDGTNDSFGNGIRNQVYPSDQNYTKLQLNSMQSNDIVNVNITGLS